MNTHESKPEPEPVAVVSGDGSAKTIQDRRPNFRDKSGQLFLVRCFACGGEHGRENYIPAVATGTCAWCGWPNTKTTDAEAKP